MDIDKYVTADVAREFVRTRAEWAAALQAAAGDHDEVFRLACELAVDPALGHSNQHALLKGAAKLLGCSLKALRADIDGTLPANDDDGKKDDLAFARETIESFGAESLLATPAGFWAWSDAGVWAPLEPLQLRQAAQRVLEGQTRVSAGLVSSVVQLVANELYDPKAHFDEPQDRRINCQNGTLDFIDGAWTLREHRKSDYLTTQIPVAYDPAATCPRFDRFLAEIFEGDEDAADKSALICEMLGYSLLQSCRYEKFIILTGGGSNGKSVLLEVLRALVGAGQCAAVDPTKLGSPFQRAHLRGKLANIVPELPAGGMLADAEVKALVSGDLMTAEFKGRDAFDFVPFATLWAGTNHLPHTRDLSHGMARRALIVPFNRTFGDDDREIGLADRLKAELPGILAKALRALAQVFERGRFTEPASCRDALKAWRLSSDQVAQFVEDRCVCDPLSGDMTLSKHLFTGFLDWARDANLKHQVTRRTFAVRLQALGFKHTERVSIGGERGAAFFNIRLRGPDDR